MRVLPHLPSPMPGYEHRSCPARRHIGRQRFYNLPELLEIVPAPGYSGMGLMARHQDLHHFLSPRALRIGSMMSFSSFPRSSCPFDAVVGGCGWIRTTVPFET
jgi:hypothetical protein